MQIFFFHSLHDIRSSLTPYRLNSHKYTFHLVSLFSILARSLSRSISLSLSSQCLTLHCVGVDLYRQPANTVCPPCIHNFMSESIFIIFRLLVCAAHDNYISLGFRFASKLIEFFSFLISTVSFVWHFIDSTFHPLSPHRHPHTHILTRLLSHRYRSQQWNYSCNVTARAHSHFFFFVFCSAQSTMITSPTRDRNMHRVSSNRHPNPHVCVWNAYQLKGKKP